MIPIVVLMLVFTLTAIRRVGKVRLQIWQIMLAGAVAVLLTRQISPADAWEAINFDVMLFLLGVFIVGQALEDSGYLSHLSYRLFRRARSLDSLVLHILFGVGMFSGLLMNDTLAIIGAPLAVSLAGKAETQPKILLLSLAFAVTIGSVMSPIGNPQNLLISIHGNVASPFLTFIRYLLLPTLLNLLLAYLLLRLFFRREFHKKLLATTREPVKDPILALLSRISLILLAGLILVRISATLLSPHLNFRLTFIALVAALPVVAFIPKRPGMLRRIDWHTLIFFASMFVLMRSVWDSAVFEAVIQANRSNIAATEVVLPLSAFLSQFLSNVPLVALYLPLVMQTGASTKAMMALAAGSTIAGNLTILGAASNVIVIQNSERRGGPTLTFWEFSRIGIPLGMANLLVYWLFLHFV